MTTISEFSDITIRMYYEETNPPHFHAYFSEYEIIVSIVTVKVISGHFPRQEEAIVLEWALLNKQYLLGNWKTARKHQLMSEIPAPTFHLNILPKLTSLKACADYRLYLEFEDGTEGNISVNGRLFGPAFQALQDPDIFIQANIDQYGAISWPTGLTLAPDGLYKKLLPQDKAFLEYK